jgi:uncharacterized protein
VDNQQHIPNNHFLGSGWAFPVTFTAGYHTLKITASETNINESINIILQTRCGERCMNPQFGAGVQQFFFKKIDDTLKGQIADTVKTALLLYEPRITVLNVTVDCPAGQNGLVEVSVLYQYNQTNTRHNYVFPFHITEGTNLAK